jgi:hypothetical protein
MHDRLDLNSDFVGRYRRGSLLCDFPLRSAPLELLLEPLDDRIEHRS